MLFTQDDFSEFERDKLDICYVGISQYDKEIDVPAAYPPLEVKNNLGQVLAANNKKQLRIAETEKYAHVTFFFNSQLEEPNKGEERILVHSPKVKSYDLQPEMSAYSVTEGCFKRD